MNDLLTNPLFIAYVIMVVVLGVIAIWVNWL